MEEACIPWYHLPRWHRGGLVVQCQSLVRAGSYGSLSHSGFQASEVWPLRYSGPLLGNSENVILPITSWVSHKGKFAPSQGSSTLLSLLFPVHVMGAPARVPPPWVPLPSSEVPSPLLSDLPSSLGFLSHPPLARAWWRRAAVARHRTCS